MDGDGGGRDAIDLPVRRSLPKSDGTSHARAQRQEYKNCCGRTA